jgi:hypothetical protein
MFRGLDAFGRRVHAKAVREADDGQCNRRVVRFDEHIADERLIDLQRIDAKALQISEAK